MKSRKLRIAWSIVVGLLILVALFASRQIAISSDKAWVLKSSSLKLNSPHVTLSGASLQKLLSEFDTIDNGREWGLGCVLRERCGTIVIDGVEYPVTFRFDKFQGNMLELQGRWKTIVLYCNDRDYDLPFTIGG